MQAGRLIQRNRARLDAELRDSWKRMYFSPAILSLSSALIPRLRGVASGTLLDVGSGTMPFRAHVRDLVDGYRSLDIERRVPDVDFVADVRDMDPVASATCDVVLCSEVLEHVSEPDKAITEMMRVLKPGGHLVLTVPFLSRLHEEPSDFFRFTEYGLRSLLERAGFEIAEIVPTGSLFSFVGHQVSTVVVCGSWGVPVVRDLSFWLNLVLVVLPCYWIDRLAGIRRKMPLNYVAVAVKPG
jgi:SAM-dependent methyltransferase